VDTTKIQLILADDDQDDCFLFQMALEGLSVSTALKVVHDGEQLMHYLTNIVGELPKVLFLDLNMPRKNGFICLEEIKRDSKLKHLPVIIFSTSYDENVADLLYKNGAQHYICKPADFAQLKIVIGRALELISKENISKPPKEKFLLSHLKAILL